MNGSIWIIACNRLFILMSPWGGLPCVLCESLQAPVGVQFYGGFLRTLTSMSEIRALG